MSNFNPGPPQESITVLKSGLKIQCFRRDPSKFFTDISKWAEALNIGHIEKWTVTADPSGHITLIVAYREHVELTQEPENMILMIGDLIDSVDDLTKQVAKLLPTERPLVSSSSGLEGTSAGDQ